jgi:hypothetical protein
MAAALFGFVVILMALEAMKALRKSMKALDERGMPSSSCYIGFWALRLCVLIGDQGMGGRKRCGVNGGRHGSQHDDYRIGAGAGSERVDAEVLSVRTRGMSRPRVWEWRGRRRYELSSPRVMGMFSDRYHLNGMLYLSKF